MRSSLALLLFTSLIPAAQAHLSNSPPLLHAVEHTGLGLVVLVVVVGGATLLRRRRN